MLGQQNQDNIVSVDSKEEQEKELKLKTPENTELSIHSCKAALLPRSQPLSQVTQDMGEFVVWNVALGLLESKVIQLTASFVHIGVFITLFPLHI